MNGHCNLYGVPCVNASLDGACNITACSRQLSGHDVHGPEQKKNLIRCSCGNVLAGYSMEGSMNITKKGRTAVVSSSHAEVSIKCERCGNWTVIKLDNKSFYVGGTT